MHHNIFTQMDNISFIAISEVQILSVITIEQRSLLHILMRSVRSLRYVDRISLRRIAIDEGVHVDAMVVVKRSIFIAFVLHK